MLDMKKYRPLLQQLLGRKSETPTGAGADKEMADKPDPVALELMEALGGKDNIFSIDACLTRLRVEVKVLGLINHDKLQKLGAIGVVIIGHEVQAIFGKRSDTLRRDLEAWFGLAD